MGATTQSAKIKNDQSTYDAIERARRARRTVEHVPIKHQKRRKRERLAKNLEQWLRYMNPQAYHMPFSDDHKKVIRKLERCIREGGLFAEACPRGFGKTTLATDCALFALVEGLRRYLVLVGSEQNSSRSLIEGIKTHLLFNDNLHELYPEVTTYFRRTEGTQMKARNLLNGEGEPLRLEITTDKLVFPRVPGSICSESCVECVGITGTIRGRQHSTSANERLRPDLAIVDDPQTKESANSPTQCETRLQTIRGDILGLAGPGEKIACCIPCTVISEGDLAEQILDKQKAPEFHGERMQMVYQWPTREHLWEKYLELYREEMREERDHSESIAYYKKRRKMMDEGVEVQWPERYVDGQELSAIQHAYNLIAVLGKEAFFAEYQNDPQKEQRAEYSIDVDLVASRVNGLLKYEVPEDTDFLTLFTDINYRGLHFAVGAHKSDGTMYCPLYGKWPSGRAALIENPEKLTEPQLYAKIWEGLTDLHEHIASLRFGTPERQINLNLSLVDCGGKWSKTVCDWCVQANRTIPGVNVHPSRGVGNRRYASPGNCIGRPGDGWHYAKWKGKIQAKVFMHNADRWREKLQKAFLAEPGAPGSCSFWGTKPREHKAIARHVCAEKLREIVRGETTDVYIWKMQPGEINDGLDALTGAMVGGAICGAGQIAPPATFGKAAASAGTRKRKPRRRRAARSVTI